jgi:hypothetical protein
MSYRCSLEFVSGPEKGRFAHTQSTEAFIPRRSTHYHCTHSLLHVGVQCSPHTKALSARFDTAENHQTATLALCTPYTARRYRPRNDSMPECDCRCK